MIEFISTVVSGGNKDGGSRWLSKELEDVLRSFYVGVLLVVW